MKHTKHFEDMLKERSIKLTWVDQKLNNPEKVENYPDGTRHFLRRISEHGNRWLRIVLNVKEQPNKTITIFFDRRVREKR